MLYMGIQNSAYMSNLHTETKIAYQWSWFKVKYLISLLVNLKYKQRRESVKSAWYLDRILSFNDNDCLNKSLL